MPDGHLTLLPLQSCAPFEARMETKGSSEPAAKAPTMSCNGFVPAPWSIHHNRLIHL